MNRSSSPLSPGSLGGIALLGALTYFRLWGYLWKEWFTSVDHKKIGIMYMVLGLVMFLRGFADALMMRMQQAIAFNGNEGISPPTTTTRSSPRTA
jgi:cytochrome o ubiquinol oxidase subunit 1